MKEKESRIGRKYGENKRNWGWDRSDLDAVCMYDVLKYNKLK